MIKFFTLLFLAFSLSLQADSGDGLLQAVYKEDVAEVKSLLQKNIDVNYTNQYGVSSLSLAAENGHFEIFQMLINKGADFKKSINGEPLLITASRSGSLEIVEWLLNKGVKSNVKCSRKYTPLLWAANEGHVKICRALIKAGADMKVSLKSGMTPIFLAARNGHLETVDFLIESGSNFKEKINKRRGGGRAPDAGTTPLRLAVLNGHFEVAVRLLEAGADANEKLNGFSLLHSLAWVRRANRGDNLEGHPSPAVSGKISSLEFVELLVKKFKADVNIKLPGNSERRYRLERKGATPFLFALHTGDVKFARLLHKLGADDKLKTDDGISAILAASGVGCKFPAEEPGNVKEAKVLIEWMLELGHNINDRNKQKQTVLHGAAYRHYAELVPFLVEKGAAVEKWNHKDSFGHDPLMIAKGYRRGPFRPDDKTRDAIIKELVKAGVKVDDKTAQVDKKKGYQP